MTARPRLVRSVPYWALIAGSVASGGVGLWLTLDKLGTMATTLADGSATGVDVYAGQSWAVLGSILIGAGLIGLALALTLAAAASLAKPEEPTLVLADDAELDEDLAEAGTPAATTTETLSAQEAAIHADLTSSTDEPIAPTSR